MFPEKYAPNFHSERFSCLEQNMSFDWNFPYFTFDLSFRNRVKSWESPLIECNLQGLCAKRQKLTQSLQPQKNSLAEKYHQLLL